MIKTFTLRFVIIKCEKCGTLSMAERSYEAERLHLSHTCIEEGGDFIESQNTNHPRERLGFLSSEGKV